MKKLIYLTFLTALFLFSGLCQSQELNGQLLLPSIMPSLVSEWQSNPALVRLQLMNNSDSSIYVRCSGTLTDLSKNQTVAHIDDNDPVMPELQIMPRQQMLYNGINVINTSAVKINDYYKNIVGTTGRIPEGNYKYCVRITNTKTGHILVLTGNFCSEFIVQIPEPVTLLTPQNGDSISAITLPLFSWTPVLNYSQKVNYLLIIKPMFEGQSLRDAMERNPDLFNKTLFSASYQYMASDPLFSLYPNASGLVWRVRAVDISGIPITGNDGWSEIWRFKIPTYKQDTTGTGSCGIRYMWRKGPAIRINDMYIYPNVSDPFYTFRPGDVIALSISASDSDLLVQDCNDNCSESQGKVVKKWGPYEDRLGYEWDLVGAGELIKSQGYEDNTILYRIPLSDWSKYKTEQIAIVYVKVYNLSLIPVFNKAFDDPIVNSVFEITQKLEDASCIPKRIKVSCTKKKGEEHPDEIVTEAKTGTCIPQPMEWEKDLGIEVLSIDGFPIWRTETYFSSTNHLILLTSVGDDFDVAKLECISQSPGCKTNDPEKLRTSDNTHFEWDFTDSEYDFNSIPYPRVGQDTPELQTYIAKYIERRKSYFPLGNEGKVVVFNKSSTQDVTVHLKVKDSRTQANDDNVKVSRIIEKQHQICGPDITDALRLTLIESKEVYNNLSPAEKIAVAGALYYWNGFDIWQLHFQAWLQYLSPPYSPCCSPGNTEQCGLTVTVKGKCFYAGSVNYALFGLLTRLTPLYTKQKMKERIFEWKELRDASNLEASQDWAEYGWNFVDDQYTSFPGSEEKPQCKTECNIENPFSVFRVRISAAEIIKFENFVREKCK